LDNRKDIGIYPLKQFAHVNHGNPNAQGRTAMGSLRPADLFAGRSNQPEKRKARPFSGSGFWFVRQKKITAKMD